MHSWFGYCTDASAYERCRNLNQFVKALHSQSNTEAAQIPYRETVRWDQDHDTETQSLIGAPRYFGAGFEAFAETFLTVFDDHFNLSEVRSVDSAQEDQEDTGYDITAVSAREKLYRGMINKRVQQGSPVYVQVKGALNPTRQFTTNDGSRIMNFYANAQSVARMTGKAYQARYLLFTSAQGLHYKLEANTHKDIEVIGHARINKMIRNNPLFWNPFRKQLGLAPLAMNSRSDPEFECLAQELAEENISEH